MMESTHRKVKFNTKNLKLRLDRLQLDGFMILL